MEKHIEKLMIFIESHDPYKYLNTLSYDDKELKEIWKQAQSNEAWGKIKSSKDVEFLIKSFENCVTTAPCDIRARNAYKNEMLVAQYKAIRGLKKWCQQLDTIPMLITSDFPMLTESEVDRLIMKMQNIIKHI